MALKLLLLAGLAWAQLPPGFPDPPPPEYMVDNTGNTCGVAPDKVNFTDPVTSHKNAFVGLGAVNASMPASIARRYTHPHAHAHAYAHARRQQAPKEERHRDVARSDSGYWLEYH